MVGSKVHSDDLLKGTESSACTARAASANQRAPLGPRHCLVGQRVPPAPFGNPGIHHKSSALTHPPFI
ncbi:hypothetical protein CEXT_120861 [Caerostris extrusa]|uniref:Uncharacterized protein n=1 Tax=Caerostris extrusa TaxID=172846 RepID=A0AAV4TM22_CAEEX|nr:hypothetical protein CEXT_120861 [Caerostris extrusa]